MIPQEAKDTLGRMDTWQGMTNDEAHDLLGEAMEFIASMRVEYGVAYGPSDGSALWEPWRWHADLAVAQREATRVSEDAEVVKIMRRMVSTSEAVDTVPAGGERE